jgi:hypothetical protein
MRTRGLFECLSTLANKSIWQKSTKKENPLNLTPTAILRYCFASTSLCVFCVCMCTCLVRGSVCVCVCVCVFLGFNMMPVLARHTTGKICKGEHSGRGVCCVLYVRVQACACVCTHVYNMEITCILDMYTYAYMCIDSGCSDGGDRPGPIPPSRDSRAA